MCGIDYGYETDINYRYYVSGRLKVKSGKKWKSVGGTGSYMMEVKEGDSNYGVKAKNRK